MLDLEVKNKPLDGRVFVVLSIIVMVPAIISLLSGSRKLLLFLIIGAGLLVYGLVRWSHQGSERKEREKYQKQRTRMIREREEMRRRPTNRVSFGQQTHKYCGKCRGVVRGSDNFCNRCGSRV